MEERCRRKFEGHHLNVYALFMQVISALRWQAFMVRPKRGEDLKGKDLLKDLKLNVIVSVVSNVKWIKWESPYDNMLKLNVDGASKGNSGLSGGGMVVRDCKGQLVTAAAAAFYGVGSNMMAECLALLDGLTLIRQNGLEGHHFLIESDSQVLVQMVMGNAVVPWRLKGLLDQILKELETLNYHLRHIYREANTFADFLASYAVHSGRWSVFSESDTLPLAGRSLLQQDQRMFPVARVRKAVFCVQRQRVGVG